MTPEPKPPFKVLVVDDSFIMRKLVCEVVASDPDFTVCGQAENGRVALQMLRQLKPDAVLLDIEMPEMSGLETLRRLGLRSPCPVIILSSLVGADSAERLEALRLGAAATIDKPSGAVSLDLKQRRASTIVTVLRKTLGLPPALEALEAGAPPSAAPEAAPRADQAVLDCLPGGVLLFDARGRLSAFNAAAGRILRLPGLALGRRVEDVFDDFNAAMAQDIRDAAVTGEAIEAAEADYAAPDGEWVPLRLSARALGGAGFAVTFEDASRERQMRALLAKTQSSGVAQAMAAGEGLGGALKRASILFSDIRGFTGLSEALGPEGTVAMLNEYFSFMADVIRDQGGSIDKYIGDAIMATFGVPQASGGDEGRAVGAARAMIGALGLLNERGARRYGGPLKIGVGLATGTVLAGAIGSAERMNYTVIGDAANLASRLEGLTKPYGAAILACGETVAGLDGATPMRQVDRVRVKGQTKAVAVFEIFVDSPTAGQAGWLSAFEAGFQAYAGGEFGDGAKWFDKALKANPADKMSGVLLGRCQALKDAKDWDGVWTATEK